MARRVLFSVILFALVLTVTPVGAPRAAGLNETGLEVVGESNVDKFFGAQSDVNQIKECRGGAPAGVILERAGITAQRLREGVSCVAGGFDGEGYRYFVLYEPPRAVDRRFLVLIFHRGSVVGTQVIKGPGYLVAFPPNHPQRKYYPQFDWKVPALIFLAEGDRGWVFFLNGKTRFFEEVPYKYPPGAD
jgi:hypothetical protein